MINPLKYFRDDYLPWAFWPVLIFALLLGFLGYKYSSVEVGALALTAIFILWYCIETSKLVKTAKSANILSEKTRREMILANQISIQPILALEYAQGPPWLFSLKNVGRGSAINIRIETNNPEYNFRLNGLNVMKDGEEKKVELLRGENELDTEDWQLFGTTPIEATIKFERTKKIFGDKAILKTKIRITNPPKTEIIETYWMPR